MKAAEEAASLETFLEVAEEARSLLGLYHRGVEAVVEAGTTVDLPSHR
jgi:hypothetical protein